MRIDILTVVPELLVSPLNESILKRAQEGGFAVMFRGIFPDALLFVALMLWRFCTYYLSVLVGAAMTIAENVSSLRGKKGSPVSRN